MTENVEMLMRALDYIEDNIAGRIMISDLVKTCYVSLSSLQKTFKYAFGVSIKEYILRRRFSCAAKDLISSDASVLDIALKYGYSNAESFTRGFRKVWEITPSAFRRTRHFTNHTPKFRVPDNCTKLEESIMSSQRYDLSNLYDVIQERKNNAYVCTDLGRLLWINENLGIEAGDAAILEMMRRIENACDPDDIILRIGGDEFVVFTASTDMSHASNIVEKIVNLNGQPIKSGENEFPVYIHVGAFKGFYDGPINVNDMFNVIGDEIKKIHQ